MISEEKVLEALKNVIDPDLKKDIVTLGMVKNLKVEGNKVSFAVELTTPACPLKEVIKNACIHAVKEFVSQDAEVHISMTARPAVVRNKEASTLRNVRHIIAIASGKGGVGKSTVAANLAIALRRMGGKTGIVDADIYGPSQHILFGVENESPGPGEFEGQKKMKPVESWGVLINSIGFLAPPEHAVALRGPMASKALYQLFYDTVWGELDYLIVDLPPGTGDIQISLCTQIPLTGAVIVCTPQKVAISDARKGISLFQIPSINVPVLGLIENMSWFTPEEYPDHRYYIFGKDGIKNLSNDTGIPLLGQIPLIQSVREDSDAGKPPAADILHPACAFYDKIAAELVKQIALFEHQKKEVKTH